MKRGDVFIDDDGKLGRVMFSLFGLILYRVIGDWDKMQEDWNDGD